MKIELRLAMIPFALTASLAIASMPLLEGCGGSTDTATSSPSPSGRTNDDAAGSVNGPDSGGGGSSSSSGSSGSSSSGSSGGTAMCHDVALRGSEVSSIERTGRAPAAIGGVVADGIYALTAIHVYGSDRPLALRAQTTVQKTGNMVSSISIENGKTERTNASLSFAGVNVTSTPTCRFPDPGGTAQGRTAEYSVEGAEYRVYATAGRATIEQIFTRM